MKESTEYSYKFTNSGTQSDTVEGIGNYKKIVLDLARWLPATTMNNSIRIDINRKGFADKGDDFAAMLASVLESSEGVEVDDDGNPVVKES